MKFYEDWDGWIYRQTDDGQCAVYRSGKWCSDSCAEGAFIGFESGKYVTPEYVIKHLMQEEKLTKDKAEKLLTQTALSKEESKQYHGKTWM